MDHEHEPNPTSVSPPTGIDSSLTNQAPLSSGRPGSRGKWLLGVILLIGLLAVYLMERKHSPEAKPTDALITVAVAKVTRTNLFNLLTIPAEFRPYLEVELHAKVSGYVQQMKVDFGDKVKAHDLLATLEVPELRDQLRNAQAMEQRAEADATNSQVALERLQSVVAKNTNLVAQQEIDNARAKANVSAASVAAARAERERYESLVNYTRITAPFDGVITRRYADPGSLIQAGTSSDTQSKPLVRISDNYHLRLDIPLSVLYVKDVKVGDAVEFRVESLGNKAFTGTINRLMGKITDDTRTMIVEVEMANADLEVVPGMYASVELKVQPRINALVVPSEVVGGERNPTVYVINSKSEIEARPITLGLETPGQYEVASGLKEGELVMVGNRSFVHPGQKVETHEYVRPVMQ